MDSSNQRFAVWFLESNPQQPGSISPEICFPFPKLEARGFGNIGGFGQAIEWKVMTVYLDSHTLAQDQRILVSKGREIVKLVTLQMLTTKSLSRQLSFMAQPYERNPIAMAGWFTLLC